VKLYGFFQVEGATLSGVAPLSSLDDVAEALEEILLELGIVWAEVSNWYVSIHSNGVKPH